ncbi:MAG: hypothetical protein ACXVX9_12850 [Mycobacteriaceae bacterium]
MSRFDADYEGIGELLRSEMIGNALYTRGEAVRGTAEATAPFDAKSKTHFRDAFHTAEPKVRDGGDRMVVTVYNDDDAAVDIELGTSYSPAHRTLTKALDAAGNS